MAERRMFAKTIIDSDAFIDMPQSSQLLYFHLAMRADDDGFINSAKSIMRNTGCKEDDLKVLVAKKFIIPFDSGVLVIKHWRIHNYIQKDRYNETKYKDERAMLELDDNNSYTACIQNGYKLDTQVRLGKVRLGEDSIEEPSEEKPTPKLEPKPEPKPMSEADSELLKYLKAEHKNYAINICGYDDTAFAENNNWGQFMRNCWPTVRTKDKNWIWSVLSAAYSDKWCNGPKGKYAVQVIFSAGVLKVLEPAIEKALDYKLTETRPPPPLPPVSDYEWILANDPKDVRRFLHGSGYDDPTIDKIFELAKAYQPEGQDA